MFPTHCTPDHARHALDRLRRFNGETNGAHPGALPLLRRLEADRAAARTGPDYFAIVSAVHAYIADPN